MVVAADTPLTGLIRPVDVDDINLGVVAPLQLDPLDARGFRNLSLGSGGGINEMLARSSADSVVENTTTETDFTTKFSVAANTFVVGQVYRMKITGIISMV